MSKQYPRIRFEHAGSGSDSSVWLVVDLPSIDVSPVFKFGVNSQPAAQAMAMLYRQELRKHFALLKREAYNAGYRDGRAKRKKRDHFCGDLDHNQETL